MASPLSIEQKYPQAEPRGYFVWSRDLAVGIFAVLPLWLLYEVLRLTLAPEERNGAEALVTDGLTLLGPNSLVLLRIVFVGTVLWAAVSIHRRRVPWARVALVSAFEGAVYGLMLGPVTSMLTSYALDCGTLGSASTLGRDLIGSLGAGIFEEAVFRLGLLSALAFLLGRFCHATKLPVPVGLVVAVVVSSVLFSAFHHVGGEEFDTGVFVYRTIAGIVLGCLFWARGFSVCVYTHALYDVYYYMSHLSSP